MKGQTDKCSHLTIYCKCSYSLFTHWQFHWSDYSPCWGGLFFFSWIFSLWIWFHNQHNMLLLVCVYITDLHSNHISYFSPSMLKCRCSRGNWEKKVACAKHTVGINKHFIGPWRRNNLCMGEERDRKKEGKKDSIVLFRAVWEMIINR